MTHHWQITHSLSSYSLVSLSLFPSSNKMVTVRRNRKITPWNKKYKNQEHLVICLHILIHILIICVPDIFSHTEREFLLEKWNVPSKCLIIIIDLRECVNRENDIQNWSWVLLRPCECLFGDKSKIQGFPISRSSPLLPGSNTWSSVSSLVLSLHHQEPSSPC